MQLFIISENGALRKIKKIDFDENKSFLIDDYKIIYIWNGAKTSKKKKELSINKANQLNKKRNNSAVINIIDQNKEYGSFLAMMDLLKKGVKDNIEIERRPELELETEDTLDLIEAGLTPDLEAEITLATQELKKQEYPYEELCKKLAELQLNFLKVKPTKQKIVKKAEEIYKSSITYDELCWLIEELNILKEKKSTELK
jgi:hypothetical protein